MTVIVKVLIPAKQAENAQTMSRLAAIWSQLLARQAHQT
jgi:hypothetical protein